MATGATTVLVVDDEPSLRLLCRVNLELEGFTVLEAATLSDARELLETNEIDVIVLDVHVGGGDGRDLMDELRSSEAPVKILMLTGSADIASPRFAVADEVMSKPFDPRELIETVRRLSNGSPVDSNT